MSETLRLEVSVASVVQRENERYPDKTTLANIEVDIDPGLAWELFTHCTVEATRPTLILERQ